MTRIILLAVMLCLPLASQDVYAWPDTHLARVEALALIETLNAEVLASRSATLTLEAWCRDHHLAQSPKITAARIKGTTKPATTEQRERLQVTTQDEVKYRRVQLRCGDHILSEADNWYVPSRLTPEMNRLLDTTETPFGKAVQALQPYRQTFAVKLLWSPLPEGWELSPLTPDHRGDFAIPQALFEHRAILYTHDHKPFSEVDEVYQGQLLAFPPPR